MGKKRSQVTACPKRVYWEEYFHKYKHRRQYRNLNDAYQDAREEWDTLSEEDKLP
jgi:hypothetical protein